MRTYPSPVRVTARAERELVEVAPGVRRGVYFDAPEGARQLSMILAEIDPGREIPLHRHEVEEGFYVLDGSGVVVVGGQERLVATGSFCIMPAREFHTVRNTGGAVLRLVAAFSGTNVKMERKA